MMDPIELAKIITESNSVDLQVMVTAKEQAKRRLLDDPSAANISAFEKAKRCLDEATGAKPSEGVSYKNRAEAHRELERRGYKIKKSKFYKDCTEPGKTKGLCVVESNGAITESSLQKYVQHPGSRLTKPDRPDGAEEKQGIKLEREIERIEQQIRLLRLDAEKKSGEVISRQQFFQEQVGLLVVVQSGLDYLLRTTVRDEALQKTLLNGVDEMFRTLATKNIEFEITITNGDAADTNPNTD
jgi:hypothetical protein